MLLQAPELVQLLRSAPVTAVQSADSTSTAADGAADVRRLLLQVAHLCLLMEAPNGGQAPGGTTSSTDASGGAAARNMASQDAGADSQYVTAWVAAATAAAQPESRSVIDGLAMCSL